MRRIHESVDNPVNHLHGQLLGIPRRGEGQRKQQ
jgi:hypothetical protein